MNEEPVSAELPAPHCHKCHGPMPEAMRPRQLYCTPICRNTANTRKRRNQPIADPHPALDELVAERNLLALQLRKIQPKLESSAEKLQAAASTKRRLAYAADTADTNADKKIGHHGAAIETARHHAEAAEEVASGHRAEVTALRGQVTELENQLGQALATAATSKTQATSPATPRPTVNLTLATQVYWSFHRLAKDYREILRGTDLNDDAYRIFDHAARNNDRRKTNTTEVDLRTLYHFSRLTQAAYKRAQQLKIADVPTNNAVNLHNTISKLVKIPTAMPPLGAAIQLPATTTPKDQP